MLTKHTPDFSSLMIVIYVLLLERQCVQDNFAKEASSSLLLNQLIEFCER